jgi:phosphoribosylformimino-5-aminoimidazole carboxamide ribotide isomerase
MGLGCFRINDRFFYPLKLKVCGENVKVLPVIDILNGKVVHAVKGQRNQYLPLQSSLTPSTQPAEVLAAFKTLGFSEAYVADLDAILDCTLDFTDLKALAATGVELMVDAGITSLDRAQRLLDAGVGKLVVGTETLQRMAFVSEATERFGSSRVVMSLDLKGETVLVKPDFDGSRDALTLIHDFKARGISQVIVLDLLRVGSGAGVNASFLRQAINVDVDIIVGGGVRNITDLLELKALGASGALVASALHSGKIRVADLKAQGMLG